MEWTMAAVFWLGWGGGTAVGLIGGLFIGIRMQRMADDLRKTTP